MMYRTQYKTGYILELNEEVDFYLLRQFPQATVYIITGIYIFTRKEFHSITILSSIV